MYSRHRIDEVKSLNIPMMLQSAFRCSGIQTGRTCCSLHPLENRGGPGAASRSCTDIRLRVSKLVWVLHGDIFKIYCSFVYLGYIFPGTAFQSWDVLLYTPLLSPITLHYLSRQCNTERRWNKQVLSSGMTTWIISCACAGPTRTNTCLSRPSSVLHRESLPVLFSVSLPVTQGWKFLFF